ncbi:unnamed protein product [Rotaria sp. Silwood2]|nr:unnamed protein product [Rotaria sp. Silwood2]CAF3238681.1 unnamed protein product [Rotaria sp. Silwood2]CAF3389755.1 unnamed protein product [Rotaria sp. Silwood2]CAF4580075.1 unnamed protein product [Rotaria sp. Silwood2]CAF4628025.1 unnamed protein product [Rotaria sp. Silwood2]
MLIGHEEYATTLDRMSLVYRARGDDNKGMTSSQETLRRRYLLLDKDYLHLASTYYQHSLTHNDRAE